MVTAHAFDPESIQIHGFASTGYLRSDHNNYLVQSKEGSFEFNEAGLNFSAVLTNDIRIGMQLFSHDIGEIGNNEVALDWAFLDYQHSNTFGIRVGKIKGPFGLYNEIQDYDMLYTSILLPQGIYNKYGRETFIAYQGIGIYGFVNLGSSGRLGYDLYGGTTNIDPDGGYSKLITLDQTRFKSARIDYITGGKLTWYAPLKGLLLTTTLVTAEATYYNTAVNYPVEITTLLDRSLFSVFSAEFSHERFTLAGEYYRFASPVKQTQDRSAMNMPDPPVETSRRSEESFYLKVSYLLTDWFECGTYYSVFFNDMHDRYGREIDPGKKSYSVWQKDWAVSLRWDLTDAWLVKLEYHYIEGTGLCVNIDNPDGYDRYWNMMAFKTTYSF